MGKQSLRRMTAGLCLIILMLTMSETTMYAFASETAPKDFSLEAVYDFSLEDVQDLSENVIKVGYFDLGDYYTVKDDGTVDSYDGAYLDEIANYTGYEYKYVQCGTWSHAIEMLEAHEIDLVGTMQWTKEREEKYEICDASYGYSVAELAALKSSEYIYEDYGTMDGATVGCMGGYVIVNQLQNFMEEKNLSFQVVTYDTQKELDQALEEGKIDLVAANAHAVHEEWKVIEKFSYAPYYFASWKGNAAVTDAISDAIIQIHMYQTDFSDTTIKQYFPQLVYSPFSKEELDCISQNKSYTIYFDGTASPLTWYDQKSESMQGVLVDICKQVSELSGLKLLMEQRLYSSDTQLFDSSQKNILAQIDDNTVTYRTLYYELEQDASTETGVTNSLIDQEFELYHRIGDDFYENEENKIAIVKNRDGLVDYLKEAYPNAAIVECDTPLECMKLLAKREVDLTFLSANVAHNILITESMNQITNIPMTNVTFGIALQFYGENADLLSGIVDKSLQLVDYKKINDTLVSQALTTSPKVTLSYLIRQNLGIMVAVLVAVLLILFTFAMLLTYAKLMKREKIKIEQVSQTRTDFLSRMSHDIRTPMNGIIGMIGLAKENGNPEDTNQCLDKMEVSSKYLLALINDILDLNKIESGKVELHPEIYAYNEFRKYLDSVIIPMCKQRGMELKIQVDESLNGKAPVVDKLRVNQVFFNLVSNAVKYTPEGGIVTLHIWFEYLSETHIILYGAVSDTGIGMSREFQKHMFEFFTQEEQKLLPQRQGSGLGLAIVKKIMDLMHGTIEVESELGKGSTFTISVEVDVADVPNEQESALEPVDMTHILEGKHILVVEDHPLNQEIAVRTLENRGMLVATADNGERAVEAFKKSGYRYFDLILMDIRMPIMDGITATRIIRSLEREEAATIPIIAMTANAFDQDVKECLDSGMNGHLSKPVNPEKLYETIARWVR